jgi:hypothetical protein
MIDDAGVVLKTRRIQHSAHGYQELLELLTQHRDNQHEPIAVAVETPRGLLASQVRLRAIDAS